MLMIKLRSEKSTIYLPGRQLHLTHWAHEFKHLKLYRQKSAQRHKMYIFITLTTVANTFYFDADNNRMLLPINTTKHNLQRENQEEIKAEYNFNVNLN